VELDLVSEHVERARDEPDCSIGMAARAAAAHLLEPPLEPGEVCTLRMGEPFETAGDRIEPVARPQRARAGRAGRRPSPAPVGVPPVPQPVTK